MATGFKTATVNASLVPATQTGFPSLVDLSRPGITTLAEAQSVRVYADSGKTTEWAREIVSATEMHVKIPSITSTTPIYIEWDGVRSDYAATDTYGRNAVWSEYSLVMHMDDATTDSTGNYTPSNNGATTTTGKIGGAMAFNGSTQYILTTTVTDITAFPVTLSAWGKSNNTTANQTAVSFDDSSGNSSTNQRWGRLALMGGVANDPVRTQLYNTSSQVVGNDLASYTASTWEYYNAVITSSNGTSYINTTANTPSSHSGSFPTGINEIQIGRLDSYSTSQVHYFNGDLDEVRIALAARSSNWITTEYNNQSNESSFWGTWSDVGGATFVPKITMI